MAVSTDTGISVAESDLENVSTAIIKAEPMQTDAGIRNL